LETSAIDPGDLREDAMKGQSSREAAVVGRRIQLTRRARRLETLPDTTVTDSWPPRLNTAL
jgi:hypothetical protein